jgi:hypothetical protein
MEITRVFGLGQGFGFELELGLELGLELELELKLGLKLNVLLGTVAFSFSKEVFFVFAVVGRVCCF